MTTTEKVINYLRACDISRVRDFDAASGVGCSVSCLRKRLKNEGATYAELLAAEKRRRCSELLAINPHADVQLIAKKCGYASPSGVGRAFKQWYGRTLREWKSEREANLA